MSATTTSTDQIIYDESGSAIASIPVMEPELTPTYIPRVGPGNTVETTTTDGPDALRGYLGDIPFPINLQQVLNDQDAAWARVVQSIPGLAERMLETVIYPYEDIVMTLDDYLHVDEGDAQALGVVLLNGNRFSKISDIRIDEMHDTQIAVLTKILEQLVPQIRAIVEDRA